MNDLLRGVATLADLRWVSFSRGFTLVHRRMGRDGDLWKSSAPPDDTP